MNYSGTYDVIIVINGTTYLPSVPSANEQWAQL